MKSINQLNNQQIKAVQTTGPLLVLSGPGAGKSLTLTHRVKYLIEDKNINPASILTLTFSNKAASDMKDKLTELIGNKEIIDNIWLGTFHATGLRILMDHLKEVGYSSNYLIYDNEDAKEVIKEIIEVNDLDSEIFNPDIIFNTIQEAKRKLINPEDTNEKLAFVYRKYERRLKNNNAFDFNDLIKKTIELFTSNKDILNYYQEKFKYILIDEFQDTNSSQYLLTKLLARPENNLFVLGDSDQNIFSFQGADITNILDFEEYYPEATIIKLEQNYRSTKNIIKAAQSVIKNNSQKKKKSIFTNNRKGPPLTLYKGYNPQSEARFVARKIKELNTKNYDYEDIAIFYRTHYQASLIEDLFIKHNIPYQIVNKTAFWDKKEIKDLLSYLKVIVNPMDSISLKRIMKLKSNEIGNTTIDKLLNYKNENQTTMLETLEKAKEIKGIGRRRYDNLLNFKELFQQLQSISEKDISLIKKMELMNEQIGYREHLNKYFDNSAKRIANLEKFLEIVDDYSQDKNISNIHQLLCNLYVIRNKDLDGDGESDNKVKLMTAHRAKGLEFKVVFIIGLEEDTFPHYLNKDENSIEEERRLFYVAMTRAEEKLFLTHCKKKEFKNEMVTIQPSRFLEEIPIQYLKNIKIA